MKKHKVQIDQWLKNVDSEGDDLVLEFDTGNVVGRVIERGEFNPMDTKKVKVVIRRNPNVPQGWYFVIQPIPSYSKKLFRYA